MWPRAEQPTESEPALSWQARQRTRALPLCLCADYPSGVRCVLPYCTADSAGTLGDVRLERAGREAELTVATVTPPVCEWKASNAEGASPQHCSIAHRPLLLQHGRYLRSVLHPHTLRPRHAHRRAPSEQPHSAKPAHSRAISNGSH